MLELNDVSFAYNGRPVLCGISLKISRGEHVAIVGPNASGKSTLAMIMNALIFPDVGDCVVEGVNTKDDPMNARKTVAMVFQDPDSQAAARLVRDDVAFGPNNLGLSTDEAERRVQDALLMVGLCRYAERRVSSLSGGQKQLLALAGALVMGSSYVVLDEPTSLLDGSGAKAVRDAAVVLKSRGAGIIWIAHDMEEAMAADRIIVLKDGKVLASRPPEELFCDNRLMSEAGIEPPYSWLLQRRLKKIGMEAPALKVREPCRW